MSIFTEDFNVKTASNDSLSFVGDAIYSLLVREKLIEQGLCKSASLHSVSATLVNASAQAKGYEAISQLLTDEEIAVYKRGRNAHNNHKPKRADSGDYHSATGLEALFGYLYLSNQNERIKCLFEQIWANK